MDINIISIRIEDFEMIYLLGGQYNMINFVNMYKLCVIFI